MNLSLHEQVLQVGDFIDLQSVRVAVLLVEESLRLVVSVSHCEHCQRRSENGSVDVGLFHRDFILQGRTDGLVVGEFSSATCESFLRVPHFFDVGVDLGVAEHIVLAEQVVFSVAFGSHHALTLRVDLWRVRNHVHEGTSDVLLIDVPGDSQQPLTLGYDSHHEPKRSSVHLCQDVVEFRVEISEIDERSSFELAGSQFEFEALEIHDLHSEDLVGVDLSLIHI